MDSEHFVAKANQISAGMQLLARSSRRDVALIAASCEDLVEYALEAFGRGEREETATRIGYLVGVLDFLARDRSGVDSQMVAMVAAGYSALSERLKDGLTDA